MLGASIFCFCFVLPVLVCSCLLLFVLEKAILSVLHGLVFYVVSEIFDMSLTDFMWSRTKWLILIFLATYQGMYVFSDTQQMLSNYK